MNALLKEDREAWHAVDGSDVAEKLETSISQGLAAEEAARRLERDGYNELTVEKVVPWWAVLFEQLREPLIVILTGAALVTGFLGEWMDFGAILFVVILNAVIGTIQQVRAEKALSALKNLTPPMATVVRGGATQRISAKELVVGDLVLLQAGDKVPADMRLLNSHSLRVDEAPLTGESVPVDKIVSTLDPDKGLADRTNMSYAGTSVAYGRGDGIVIATGMNTEVGRIAQLLNDQESKRSPLQQELARVGSTLSIIVGILVGAFFIVGLIKGAALLEMFLTSVGLAVAAIPEGLPTVVTVVLALGVQRMAVRKALVRKLPAVETLGCATFICSDKTGTLTQNKMKLTSTFTMDNDISWLLVCGYLNNDASLPENGSEQATGDPTEIALLEAALEKGFTNELLAEYPRVDEIPFDSGRKRMTTVHHYRKERYVSVTKGAADVMLDLSNYCRKDGETIPLDAEGKARIIQEVTRLSSDGLRVLAVAERSFTAKPSLEDAEENLTFVGLFGLSDPPREEVADAIKTCKKAGITPVMITGDHVATAVAIGKQIGMLSGEEVAIEGKQLSAMSDEELKEAMAKARVFARVAPEDKLRIVSALQARGQVVAMTGDGVNDAPALRKADIGVAMGITGTDVAKEASSMTLADDNFATIVKAVEEGRTVYANIQKAVHYLLSCNFGEIIAVFGAALANIGNPLSAVQILWINLVTDTAPALGLGVEPSEEGVMSRPPRSIEEGILSRAKLISTIIQGVAVGLLTLASYYLVLKDSDSREMARTAAFATLGLVQFVQAYNMRSTTVSVFRDKKKNPTLVKGILIAAILHVATFTIPPLETVFGTVSLKPTDWVIVLMTSFGMLVVGEIIKFIRRRSENV